MPLREFVDNRGHRWFVWDVNPSTNRGGESRTSGGFNPPPWLAFQCTTTGERRRLVPVPDDWSARADSELCALCDEAEQLAQRRWPVR